MTELKKPREGRHPGIDLDEALNSCDMTRSELARKMGVAPSFISAITNGRKKISGQTSLRIATALGNDPWFWADLENEYAAKAHREQSSEE